ncbi:MAG: hypothetical protein ACYCT2_04760 [Thermoplasmataceae archaeon]
MTEFRSKGEGKDRVVYPVKKKQAFGVPRNLAYSEVQALRAKGMKARLIKTNRTLDLYAPYESVLPSQAPAAQAVQEPAQLAEPSHLPARLQHDSGEEKRVTPGLPVYEFMEKVAGKMKMRNPTVYNNNGSSEFVSVDDAHVYMVFAKANGEMNEDDSQKLNGGSSPIRLPKLDFGSDGDGILMTWRERSDLIRSANDLVKSLNGSGNHVQARPGKYRKYSLNDIAASFYSEGGGNGYVVLSLDSRYKAPEDDRDGTKYTVVMKAGFAGDKDLDAAFNASLLKDVFNAYNLLSPKSSAYLSLKSDYPMAITPGKLASGGIQSTQFGALLAPMMTTDLPPVKRIIGAGGGA